MLIQLFKSDQHLISPLAIFPESHFKVTRIKIMITNWKSSRFLNKFSLSVPSNSKENVLTDIRVYKRVKKPSHFLKKIDNEEMWKLA